MIVKNEAHVLARSLRSVKPLIDSWVIVDTGSTDETERVVRESLADVPGEYVSRPWVDFGSNRTEALGLSRVRGDYSLIVDADDELEYPQGFAFPELADDAYYLSVDVDGTRFLRLHLLKSDKPWRYDGVLHEEAACDGPVSRGLIPGLTYRIHEGEGARSNAPDKYLRDAETLERALEREPDNARYVYYLGQSYRSLGDRSRALEAYRRRVAMGGDEGELYFAQFYVAALLDSLDAISEDVVWAYLNAHALRPSRAEPLVGLANYYRRQREPRLAVRFASQALALPRPVDDPVLVDEAAYAWQALHEYALACRDAGLTADARRADQRLLAERKLPPVLLEAVRTRLGVAQ